MKDSKTKPRKIFVVNFDWRDLFRTGKEELFEKLQRDMLCPEVNEFFFFSWAHESYTAQEEKWQTVHKRTYGLHILRPIFNLWALFLIPCTAYKHKVTPDAWLVYDFGMVPAMWLASKLFGGVLVMKVNHNPQDCSASRKFGAVRRVYAWTAERIGVRFVKHFFTLNESMRAYLVSLGASKENVHIYTVNTIERDIEHIEKVKAGSIRKEYGISDDKKMLLTVARLEDEKNYPLLIDMFAKLPEQYVLLCLGEGSLMPALKEQSKTLGIDERIIFVGNVERDKIWNYYKDADAFVLLSKAEALGIVFWEAMYMHVPTIGSDIEGIIESLGKNGERGKIWREVDGEEGFKELVSFCATESDERDKMVSNARKFVDKQLENRDTINDFLHYLENK